MVGGRAAVSLPSLTVTATSVAATIDACSLNQADCVLILAATLLTFLPSVVELVMVQDIVVSHPSRSWDGQALCANTTTG